MIGANGKRINDIMVKSQTKIIVSQPIYQMTKRTIIVDGDPLNVAEAIHLIYSTLDSLGRMEVAAVTSFSVCSESLTVITAKE